jgi:hypothetical protein
MANTGQSTNMAALENFPLIPKSLINHFNAIEGLCVKLTNVTNTSLLF